MATTTASTHFDGLWALFLMLPPIAAILDLGPFSGVQYFPYGGFSSVSLFAIVEMKDFESPL